QKAGPTALSQQQIDQDRATVATTLAQVEYARASIQVNEAAVQRYTDLQGFQKIVAPFPGVITARNIDPGNLVSADTPSTSNEIEVLQGLNAGDTVVVHPGDDIPEGTAVEATPLKETGSQHGKGK